MAFVHACGRLVVRCAATSVLLFGACSDRTPTGPELPPPPNATFELRGVVREAPPDQPVGRPIGGVRIEVFTKRGVHSTAVTASDGSFRLDGLAGSFELRIAHAGYKQSITPIANLNAARSLEIGLVPDVQTITGLVLEAAPARNVAISGARLTITSGPNAGATAVSDARGRYSLQLMGGELDLRVERLGYGVTTAQLRLTGLFSEVNLLMAPVPEVVRSLLYPDGNPSVTVQVRNAGELAIVDWGGYGFEEGDGSTLQIWVDGRLLAQTYVERSFPPNTVVLRAPVTPGAKYEVRTAETGSWYRLSVRHPL